MALPHFSFPHSTALRFPAKFSHPFLSQLRQQFGPQVDSLLFWLSWTLLTWCTFGLSLLFVEVGEKGEISLIEGLIGGALVGLTQWQILRPYLSGAYRWAIATTLSWGGMTLLQMGAVGWMAPGTHNLLFRSFFGLICGAYVGLGLGIGQWLVLRQQIGRAWRWVPLNAGIWAGAIAFGWLIGGSLRATSHLFIGEVVGLGLAWGAIAALTGLAILQLLCEKPLSASKRQSPGKL